MKNAKKKYLIISIISFVIALLALTAIVGMFLSFNQARENYALLAQNARSSAEPAQPETTIPVSKSAAPEETYTETQPVLLIDIPINFAYLQAENTDIIGWIAVDGTTIDYPVMYDTTYNLYYLNHNYAGTSSGYGSIFILGENSSDFSDFNTVVYGHNMLDGHMFAQLHKFRDRSFFDSHGEIIVYTPDYKLTYQVFAAYRNDNLDIIANNDFSTEALKSQYIDSIYAHTDLALFKPEYQVTASDRIITLSTCIGNPSFRFIVQGVLVSEESGQYTGESVANENG